MPIAGLSPREVVHTEMHRFKHGQLHSGSKTGPKVKSRAQAIAIALSEARKAKGRAMGGMTTLPALGMGGYPMMSPLQNTNMSGMGYQGAPTLGMGYPAVPPPGGFSSPQDGSSLPPGTTLDGLGMVGNSAPTSPAAPSVTAPQSGPPAPGQPPVAPTMSAPPAPSQAGWVPAAGGGLNPPGSWTPPKGFAFGGLTKPPAAAWTVRNEARSMLHSGPISSIVPGRTDRHNVSVGSGAYVMPADSVSHLGQNNTKAGQAILSHMFGSSGPYGMGKDMAVRHGPGAPKPPGMPRPMAAPHIPKFQSAGGGRGDRVGHPVPIVVAGGEFTIPPQAVAAVGGGDVKKGHRILDSWVLSIRKKHIATLRKLPPPAKS